MVFEGIKEGLREGCWEAIVLYQVWVERGGLCYVIMGWFYPSSLGSKG